MATEFYKFKEVMERLRVSRPTVNKLIADGTLKALKTGRVVRITARSLEDFIAQQTGRAS